MTIFYQRDIQWMDWSSEKSFEFKSDSTSVLFLAKSLKGNSASNLPRIETILYSKYLLLIWLKKLRYSVKHLAKHFQFRFLKMPLYRDSSLRFPSIFKGQFSIEFHDLFVFKLSLNLSIYDDRKWIQENQLSKMRIFDRKLSK